MFFLGGWGLGGGGNGQVGMGQGDSFSCAGYINSGDVMYSLVTIACITCLQFAKRVYLQCFHQRETDGDREGGKVRGGNG